MSYVASLAREGKAAQGNTSHKRLCSNFPQAGWQSHPLQALAVRKGVHVQQVIFSLRDVHLGKLFAVFISPMAQKNSFIFQDDFPDP